MDIGNPIITASASIPTTRHVQIQLSDGPRIHRKKMNSTKSYTSNSPAQNTEAIDHGCVRVRADNGIRVQ